jgi:hypothetical protein
MLLSMATVAEFNSVCAIQGKRLQAAMRQTSAWFRARREGLLTLKREVGLGDDMIEEQRFDDCQPRRLRSCGRRAWQKGRFVALG